MAFKTWSIDRPDKKLLEISKMDSDRRDWYLILSFLAMRAYNSVPRVPGVYGRFQNSTSCVTSSARGTLGPVVRPASPVC